MSALRVLKPIIKSALKEAGLGVACSRFCAVYKFSFFLFGVFVEPTSSPTHSRLMYVVIPTVIGISNTPMLIWSQRRGGLIHNGDLKVELMSYLRMCPEVFEELCFRQLIEENVSRACNSSVTYLPSIFVAVVGSFVLKDGMAFKILELAPFNKPDGFRLPEEWDDLISRAKSESEKGIDEFGQWLVEQEADFLSRMWPVSANCIQKLSAGPVSIHTGING